MAQGAKISVFDVSADGDDLFSLHVLNGLWESTIGTGSFVHSNSYGSDIDCNVDSQTVAYDEYMYEVRHEAFVWRCTFFSFGAIEAFSFNVGGRTTEEIWFQETCGFLAGGKRGK